MQWCRPPGPSQPGFVHSGRGCRQSFAGFPVAADAAPFKLPFLYDSGWRCPGFNGGGQRAAPLSARIFFSHFLLYSVPASPVPDGMRIGLRHSVRRPWTGSSAPCAMAAIPGMPLAGPRSSGPAGGTRRAPCACRRRRRRCRRLRSVWDPVLRRPARRLAWCRVPRPRPTGFPTPV